LRGTNRETREMQPSHIVFSSILNGEDNEVSFVFFLA
jgi:hypothetical protein